VILSSDITLWRNATNRVSSWGNKLGGKGDSPLEVFAGGGDGKLIVWPWRLMVGVAGVAAGV
jgi:hypothetical protein